jgi:hypothetical protein
MERNLDWSEDRAVLIFNFVSSLCFVENILDNKSANPLELPALE